MLTAVVAAPDWVTVAFQAWVTVWPLGNDQVSRQPLTGSPRLVMSTLAPKPPPHWLLIVYLTEQPVAACAGLAMSTAVAAARVRPAALATRARNQVRGDLMRLLQAAVQDAPLRVNAVGAAVLPVWLAWNPMLVDAAGASVPL